MKMVMMTIVVEYDADVKLITNFQFPSTLSWSERWTDLSRMNCL